jgi:putative ABC transport system permease protein
MAERISGKETLETMIAVGPGTAGRETAIGETRRLLRASRGLRASQEDNFALNTMEDLCRETVSLTRKITAVGIIITLFSLLIGGFGIVNIMLVSVKERTFQIGLKKALGARRRRILMEFMAEALAMSVLGAALGLMLAWGTLALIPAGVITARLSAGHIALAFAVSLVLGLASGVLPAAQAARLNPVEALRG